MKLKLVIIGVLACVGLGLYLGAQTTAGVMPYVQMQFFDNSGRILSGGLVYSYSAGTTTPSATYTDSTGGTPNANPVVLDSAGRASIWLGASAYKLVIKTSAGVVIRTIDGVTAPTLSTANFVVSSGHSFTMQSGSTSSFATDILPDSTGLRSIGAVGNTFLAAWINSLTLKGNLALSTGNTYDTYTSALPGRNSYFTGQYATATNLCGTVANVLAGVCYTLTGVTDLTNTNKYVTVKNAAGAEVWRWSQREAGVDTGTAVTSTDIMPDADNTRSLGSNSVTFKDGNFSGTLGVFGASGILDAGGGVSNRTRMRIPRWTLAGLGGIGAPMPGELAFCSNCLAGTSPCTAGPPNGAIAVYNPGLVEWDCK